MTTTALSRSGVLVARSLTHSKPINNPCPRTSARGGQAPGAFSFDRMLGTGSGFTEKSQAISYASIEGVSSVEAPDKYTEVFHHKFTLNFAVDLMVQLVMMYIHTREAVDHFKGIGSFESQIGTGMFIAKEFQKGTSYTYHKKPNYHRSDEFFPEYNFRSPYVDELKFLVTPDEATAHAALHTGKVAKYGGHGNPNMTPELKEALLDTNPELQFSGALRWAKKVVFPYGKELFYPDIRVQQAMQKAINLEELARTYYQGAVEAIPPPMINVKGFYTPFHELPKAVQEGYAYDPKKAKELMAEAGYPNCFKV